MEFYLSQSKLRDWDEMCPIEFKKKHIDKKWDFEPTEEMDWGNYFETLVIGGGINGAFSFDKSIHGPKMLKSIHKERVEIQAKLCTDWLKMNGGKVYQRQEYIRTEVRDASGQLIPIEGTLDVTYMFMGGQMAVIDLKLTGDTENDFGKFAWGAPEKMDLTQIIHYGLLLKLKYELDYFPITQYWVFDKGKDLKNKLINVKVSESALYYHIERLSQTYNEIATSMVMDDWKAKNTYENCVKCQVENCKFKAVMPEFYEIEL